MVEGIQSQPHFMMGVLKAHSRLEDVASRHTDVLGIQTAKDFEEMDRLEQEKAVKIQELVSATFSSKIWNPIAKAAQYVVSGASVLVGSSILLQQGYDTAHMLLVASGISSLAYRILEDTGFLKILTSQFTTSQQIQERASRCLDMGNLCLSLGLGIAGGLWTHQAGSFLSGTVFKTQTASSLFLLGVKIGQGAIKFKVSLIEKETAKVSAALQKVQSYISQIFQRMRQSCKDAERILQTSSQVNETMQQVVASIHTRSS
jgi:hypothetical protein